MNSNSAPDRHRWLSNSSMMVAAKLATSLKPNWKIAKLGDVAERISTGTTPPSQERRYYDGDINWYTPADIGGNRWLSDAKKTITDKAVSEKKARIFDSGTILITCIGHIGRVGILSETSSSNQQITGIKFNNAIDPEFAYYSLFARQDELQSAAPTASTLSILNQNRLSNIDFCFPSLKEQSQISKFLSWYEDRVVNRQPFTNNYPTLPDYLSDIPRIVERVETLAARAAKAQSLRAEAGEEAEFYKASLLKAAFAGKLIPNEAELNINFESGAVLLEKILAERKELTKDKKGDIPPSPNSELLTKLPKGWMWVTIDHICSRVTDGFHNTPKPTESGFPYVLATHVKSDGIDFNNCFYVSAGDHKELYAKTQVKKGDILVVNIGAGSGTPVIVNVDFEFSFKNVAILKRLSQIDEKYMFFYLLSKRGELFREISKGGAQPFLSLKSLRTIPFPLAPLSEQKRIVAYLETLFVQSDKVAQLQSETQKEIDALLPSILNKAFKSEL